MLGVFLKEEIFQLTNTSRYGTFYSTDFFFFACDKMGMKNGFFGCLFSHLYGFGSIKADEILGHKLRQKQYQNYITRYLTHAQQYSKMGSLKKVKVHYVVKGIVGGEPLVMVCSFYALHDPW